MSLKADFLKKVQKKKNELEKKEKAARAAIIRREKNKKTNGSSRKKFNIFSKWKNIIFVAKKEVYSYLDSAAFYVVLIVFLTLWQFIFFRNVFLIGEVSLNSLFNLLPWFLIIMVSAVTMGSIAKEKSEGTIELVLTHPIRELDLVLGKILGAQFFVFLAILFSIPLAVLFNQYGNFDWGVYIGQLIASFLISGALVSMGVFVSTLFSSQIATLLVTIGLSFIFILSGSEIVTVSLPFSVGAVLERISLITHFTSLARGVLDLYDILYFILFSVIFISLAQLQLLKNKYGDSKGKYSGLQIFILSIVGAAFVSLSLNSFIPLRVDLTQGNFYTLSNSTKKVLSGLEDRVNVTLYVSEKIPAQYNPILRETKYILNDYKINSGDKLNIQIKDPSKSTEVEQEALEAGVQKVQFNVIGQEELQLKTGYLGLVISSGENSESIPFLQTTNDLEYELTTLIRQVSLKSKKTVAFLTGHGEKNLFENYQILGQELSKQFIVRNFTISEEEPIVEDTIHALIISNPTEEISEQDKNAIKEFSQKGGGIIFMVDRYVVNSDLSVLPNTSNVFDLIKELYAVSVDNNMIYDLRNNNRINLQEGFVNYVVNYPFWLRTAVKSENNPIGMKIENISMPWVSTVSYDQNISQDLFNYKDLILASEFSGSMAENINVNPNQEFPSANLGERSVGVLIEPGTSGTSGLDVGKAIVIGDSELLLDSFLQRSPENLSFGLSTISWIAGDDTLADIKLRKDVFSRFLFSNETQPGQIKIISFGLSIVIPLIIGLVRFIRRRTLRFVTFEKNNS